MGCCVFEALDCKRWIAARSEVVMKIAIFIVNILGEGFVRVDTIVLGEMAEDVISLNLC